VCDITYIGTDAGWLCLAVVLDLYSRIVVGWLMSDRMTATLVCDALKMAIFRRHRPQGMIVHSDRGSQYCSHEHRQLLTDHHLICSVSKKGDCSDNAAMESWNHSLKVEAIHGERFATRDQAKAQVFDYIEISQPSRVRAFQGRLTQCPNCWGKIMATQSPHTALSRKREREKKQAVRCLLLPKHPAQHGRFHFITGTILRAR
jgi:Integrase core domain